MTFIVIIPSWTSDTQNMKIAGFVLALVAAAVADVYPAIPYKPSYPTYRESYDYPPAKYDFSYAVKDDYSYVDMGHSESRNGDNTKGQYFVTLPDGRRQTVTYYVDGYSGFVADVKYNGEPKYDYKPAYTPGYKAAEPTYKPAYKPAYEPAYKPAYQPEYKPVGKAYEPTYKPSYKPAYESVYKPTEPAYKPAYDPTYEPVYRSTIVPAYEPTYKPTKKTYKAPLKSSYEPAYKPVEPVYEPKSAYPPKY